MAEHFYNSLKEFYDRKYPAYDAALDNLYPTLKTIRKANLAIFFEYRVKEFDSFRRKFEKKNATKAEEGKDLIPLEDAAIFEEIRDGAGVRIIIPYKDRVQEIVDIIETIPNLKSEKTRDYNADPKPNGYSGFHLYCSYKIPIYHNDNIYEDKEEEDDEENGNESVNLSDIAAKAQPKVEWVWVPVEIQIRTLAQHVWATYEHKHRYKAKRARAEIGDKMIDILFKQLARVCGIIDKLVIRIRDLCESTKIAR